MSHVFDPNRLQFYLTIPGPCPYLPGRLERKIFTQLDPIDGPQLNDYLTHAGFRRSQNIIYRPACESCRECRSLRVAVGEFHPGKRFRRILRKNADLVIETKPALATDEQFDLLKNYLNARHLTGGMADMDYDRYQLMVEDCASETVITEYRLKSGKLIAAVLIDKLIDGLSMVYSYFDPYEVKRSLGNFMILNQIRHCQTLSLSHLYLGYWVPNSPKMDYKALFKPCEILTHRGWTLLGGTEDNLLMGDPI